MCGRHRYFAVFFIYIFLNSAYSKDQDGGLYKPSDHVTKFNDTTFNALISKTFTTNWLIQFYLSSCGHCINFSQYFKKFATDVYSWRDTVKIGLLDCRFYGIICRKYVTSYPSLLFYRAGTDVSSAKKVTAIFDARGLTKNLLEALSFEPFLKPKTKEELLSLEDKSVVIADPNGLLAKEIILDLRHVGKPLNWVLGKYEDGELTVVESPSPPAAVAMLVVMNGRLRTLQTGIETREAAQLAITAVWGNVTRPGDSPTTAGARKDSKLRTYVHKTAEYPQFQDIYSAISMAFRKDVLLKKVVEGEDMGALKNMLQVVTEYLHYLTNNSSYKATFTSIATMFSELEKKVKDVSSIKSDDWRKEYDATVPMPKTEDWIFCSGSTSYYRGYPCGLWTLFHSLTAMNCVKNPHLSGEKSRFLMRAVRNFVVTFFSCRNCANHFKNETKDLEKSVNSTCEAMIWLWKIHNSVNKRLANEPSEDPKFPKVQFPPVKLCSPCRNGSGSPSVPSWEVEEVRRFLPTFFSPKHFAMKHDSRIMAFASEYSKMRASTSSTVTNAIIGVTVTVTAVAVIVFISVTVYKRRKRLQGFSQPLNDL